ncbi:hypothetical protein [Burkholderia multivorans]|uniref:hypothetical protein n=1 Tax=Burkholderia multivorans TaxID=87883 RepID=UPI000D00037A|nr:hypothetical protein [Burkholderia multivorans]PRE39268.1 hypothetical protein C6P97_30725 [Burkholderia multivorans]
MAVSFGSMNGAWPLKFAGALMGILLKVRPIAAPDWGWKDQGLRGCANICFVALTLQSEKHCKKEVQQATDQREQ